MQFNPALLIAISLLAVTVCSSEGKAQSSTQPPYNRPWSVSLGRTSDTRRTAGGGAMNHTVLGVAYNLQRARISSAPLQLYLDVFRGSPVERVEAIFDEVKTRFDASGFGVGTSVIGTNRGRNSSVEVYTGVGAGLYYTTSNVDVAVRRSNFPSPPSFYTQSRSRRLIAFGGKLFAGVAIQNGVFAEASLQLPNKPLRVLSQKADRGNVGGEYADSLSGFGLRLGYRF